MPTRTTGQPCLITDGMSDVNVIPNTYVVNSQNTPIGDQVRLTSTSVGYTPLSSNDIITIRLTPDNTQIAIGQILLKADNFQSASLSIKTPSDNTWKFYASLTTNKTTFDNLYASQLQLQFISTNTVRYVKIGIVGCFPPSPTTVTTTPSATTRTIYTTISSSGTTSVCILSPWGSWSSCPVECQLDRYQYRTRSVLNGTTCSQPLDDASPCDQTPCQQCTITRESYIKQLEHAPSSDSEFDSFYFFLF